MVDWGKEEQMAHLDLDNGHDLGKPAQGGQAHLLMHCRFGLVDQHIQRNESISPYVPPLQKRLIRHYLILRRTFPAFLI